VKAKDATKEALVKVPETKSEAEEAEEATKVTVDTMKAGFQVDLEKAKQTKEDAKDAMTAATSEMFAFYSNLLSPKSKYAWNKIISKQMESGPFDNLQGVSLEGHASCFTCSPHSPSMQQSKKSTTPPMYLRSPSTSTYISLYDVYSSSTPTSPRCRTATTASTQIPGPSPRTSHSWRLS
jgi:hypothetical protein